MPASRDKTSTSASFRLAVAVTILFASALAARPPNASASDGRAVDFGRPYVTSTDPADNATGVPLDAWVLVTFSQPMNRSAWIALAEPAVTWSGHWLNGGGTPPPLPAHPPPPRPPHPRPGDAHTISRPTPPFGAAPPPPPPDPPRLP